MASCSSSAEARRPAAARTTFADLMRRSRFPDDLRTVAIAGCLAQALDRGCRPLIRGLTEAEFGRMLLSCFSGLALRNGTEAAGGEEPFDEFDELLAMLLEHRAEPTQINAWLSCCVASASLRDQHLWQDMGLPNRATLSRLLASYFPELAARNTGDMKWKKFFYRQLCQRAGLVLCKSPNCADCCDFSQCFGPEPALEPARRATAAAPG